MKREKHEKEVRQNLKSIFSVCPHLLTNIKMQETSNPSNISKYSHGLTKNYPQIIEINTLRIMTILEINYLLEMYLQMIKKSEALKVQDLQVGIIGGGVMGRLILNSLLVFTKDGLNPHQIFLSTRRTENFQNYVDNFGVQVLFDNQFVAEQVDFLIVATPATLDNWIINDLKESLQKRIQKTNLKLENQISTMALTSGNKNMNKKQAQDQRKNKITTSILQQKYQNNQNSTQNKKKTFKPLVFILTSDIYQQKCEKLFDFPVLTPTIRAKDMKRVRDMINKLKSERPNIQKEQINNFIQIYEHIVFDWFISDDEEKTKNNSSLQSKEMTLNDNAENISNKSKMERYEQCHISKHLKLFAFVFEYTLGTKSATSSISNTISLNESLKDQKKYQDKEVINQMYQFLIANHGDIQDTFFKNCRKWRMAYHNFIA